jgi:hypothetical protein
MGNSTQDCRWPIYLYSHHESGRLACPAMRVIAYEGKEWLVELSWPCAVPMAVCAVWLRWLGESRGNPVSSHRDLVTSNHVGTTPVVPLVCSWISMLSGGSSALATRHILCMFHAPSLVVAVFHSFLHGDMKQTPLLEESEYQPHPQVYM